VVEGKVKDVLEALKSQPPRDHKAILQNYQTLIKREISKNIAFVEYAGKPDEKAVEALQEHLSKHYDRNIEVHLKENEDLLVGIRITVGDDVYEDSAATRIRPLVSALT
jgi:F0F1-type ATP synthase delta subunit